MAKIILLCGKICSGKSTYAASIKTDTTVILSCDDLMLQLFDECLGDAHKLILAKCQKYLFNLAEQIAAAGSDVILDFGFWSRAQRQEAKDRFRARGIETELHYIRIDNQVWMQQIDNRNKAALNGTAGRVYFVDDNMKRLFDEAFEEPTAEEIDILAGRRKD